MLINRALFPITSLNRPIDSNISKPAVNRPSTDSPKFPQNTAIEPKVSQRPQQPSVEQQKTEEKLNSHSDQNKTEQIVNQSVEEKQHARINLPELDPLSQDLRFGGGVQKALQKELNITPAHSTKALNAYQLTGGNIEKDYVHQISGISITV
jgi:hypothetical protein